MASGEREERREGAEGGKCGGSRGVGGVGEEEVRSGDGCRRTALCSSFPRLLSRASEAPVALKPSSPGKERREKKGQ